MKNIRIIVAVVLAALSLSVLFSCSNEKSASQTSTEETLSDEQEQACIDVYNMLAEMYTYYNTSDFDTYITYWDIDEEEKATMLDNFKSSSGLFESTYQLDGVAVVLLDDGRVNVDATATSTSKNVANGTVTVLKETMYYVMTKNSDGQYRINSFSTGGTELVSYETQPAE